MNEFVSSIMEALILGGLIYGLLLYWKRRVMEKEHIPETSRAAGLYLGAQVLSILFIVLLGLDPQTEMYMKELKPFGENYAEFWSDYGVITAGYVVAFILANFFTMILFKYTNWSGIGLYEELRTDDVANIIAPSIMVIAFAIVLAQYSLKPFLLDWISRHAALIPLV